MDDSCSGNGSSITGGGGGSSGSSRLAGRHLTQLLSSLLPAANLIWRSLLQMVARQRWQLRGVTQRRLSDLDPVQLPEQTNKLALAFSPLQSPPSSFCCGLEVFQRSHITTPHVHDSAWELFFVMSGARAASWQPFVSVERSFAPPGRTAAL